jgi:hypothetical protein
LIVIWAAALATSTSGCGEPLVSGSSLNEPAFTIEGAIAPYDPSRRSSIGILWVDPALAGDSPSVSGAHQLDAHIAEDGSFSLEVFGRPPKDAVKWLAADASSDAVAIAWGELVLFEDNDGDGSFRVESLADGAAMTLPDQYAGVAEKHVLLYVEEPAEEGTQITGLARTLAAPGYVLGEAHCADASYVVAVEPNTVSLRAVTATSLFPRLRQCFESIP